MRIITAFKTFFRVLSDREFAVSVETLERRTTAASMTVLAALQREGRLVDFLLEDIDAFDDAQVGAACRPIHKNCGKVLRELMDVQPIRPEKENSRVTVEAGFDASAIRVVGKVAGDPPFQGTLKHHGWRASSIRFSLPPPEHDPQVIAPAEVEIA